MHAYWFWRRNFYSVKVSGKFWSRSAGFEVGFAGEPLLVDFAKESGGETEKGGFVWEEGSDAGPALEFLVNALKRIACAHAALMGNLEALPRLQDTELKQQ